MSSVCFCDVFSCPSSVCSTGPRRPPGAMDLSRWSSSPRTSTRTSSTEYSASVTWLGYVQGATACRVSVTKQMEAASRGSRPASQASVLALLIISSVGKWCLCRFRLHSQQQLQQTATSSLPSACFLTRLLPCRQNFPDISSSPLCHTILAPVDADG